MAQGDPHSISAAATESPDRESSSPRFGEQGVVWTLWLTYGAFYFCRTNISVAVSGMEASAGDGGLGLSKDEVGWILASLKIAYGIGQFVNGQLSERVPPRVMLAVGMFGSAALNVLFGFSTSFYFLLFVWATNGFCQSLGWTPTVRVVANWVPVLRRGNAIGIIGTGYQITLGLTYVIAGQSAEMFGWRGAMWVPAALLSAAGVFMLLFLRESPQRDPEDSPVLHAGTTRSALVAPQLSWADGLYWTLYNPTLWLLGLTLGLLNACRYGFLDWGVAHLMEVTNVKVGKATLQFFVIAIGATAGSYLTGWATDRVFGGRRAPMICILMAMLGVLSLIYDPIVKSSPLGTMLVLVVIGFCIFGPQVLLVGTAPADLAHRGTSAAAAGFVNFMGYMGAATGDVITGYYSNDARGGWQTAIYIWAGWAFAGSLVSAMLWNTTARRIGLVPSFVPKLAAVATLTTAGVAAAQSGQSTLLCVATYAASLGAVGAFALRLAVLPGLLVALIGLLAVFAAEVRGGSGVTWPETTAMVAYGLALLATAMVLLEREEEQCGRS
jgi:sugar phosphate permease